MPFFKIVAIALMTAFASPFCCCLANFAVDAEAIPTNQATIDHACCLASHGDEGQQQSPEEHAPSDCPHQIEKDSQIRQADSGDFLAKPILFFATSIPFINFESDLKAVSKAAIPARTTEMRPPSIQVAQAYCVYLL